MDLGANANGRRNRVTRSGFGTKKEARDALNEELNQLRIGHDSRRGRVSLETFLTDSWIPGLSRLRVSSRTSYVGLLTKYVIPRIGSRPLSDLRTPEINVLYAHLGKPKTAHGAGLSPASIRRVHAALHAAMADAVNWRLIAHNPATGAELPAQRRTDLRVWSAKEARSFTQAVQGDRLASLYTLILATGMRRGEAVGLRWREVDLKSGSVAVVHQITHVNYAVVRGEPESRGSRRSISLDPATTTMLIEHRDRQRAEHRRNGFDPPKYVFTTALGEPYHPDFVSKHSRLLVRRAPVPEIRLHDLRHTHAALGLLAGIPAKIMADRLGHSTVTLTLDTYSHVTPAMDRDAAALIGSLLSPEASSDTENTDSTAEWQPLGSHDPQEEEGTTH